MSVLVKKLYFDIYNLENDLKNKQQTVLEYQELFDEYILNYKEQNSAFATTYDEIDQLNKNIVQREFDKTIENIENSLKNTARAAVNPDTDDKSSSVDDESTPAIDAEKSKHHLESITKNYRDIVKITHPDKTQSLDEDTQKLYNEYYKRATNFYDNDDLYSLMLLNKLLGNNPFNMAFNDGDAENLRRKKEKVEQDVLEIQKTFIWNFMNIENEKELNAFISAHFKNMLKNMK